MPEFQCATSSLLRAPFTFGPNGIMSSPPPPPTQANLGAGLLTPTPTLFLQPVNKGVGVGVNRSRSTGPGSIGPGPQVPYIQGPEVQVHRSWVHRSRVQRSRSTGPFVGPQVQVPWSLGVHRSRSVVPWGPEIQVQRSLRGSRGPGSVVRGGSCKIGRGELPAAWGWGWGSRNHP